jgi:hypothetical protein
MQKHLTHISCLSGLAIIFIVAAIRQSSFEWVVGVAVLLIILIIRNLLGEVTQKTEFRLTTITWLSVIATLKFLL